MQRAALYSDFWPILRASFPDRVYAQTVGKEALSPRVVLCWWLLGETFRFGGHEHGKVYLWLPCGELHWSWCLVGIDSSWVLVRIVCILH